MSIQKSPHQIRVEQFMVRAEQEVPKKPCVPSREIQRLRATLIFEEAMETINALGFTITFGDFVRLKRLDCLQFEVSDLPGSNCQCNVVETLDGLADLSVVTVGTAISMGVAFEPLLELVDANNIAKFGPGSCRRDDGKWMKPPDHQPPDIAAALREQGWEEL